jgi:hypothetical protein
MSRRLDRVEGALVAASATAGTEDGTRQLAAELAQAFGHMVGFYREHYGLTPEEARAKAAAAPDEFIEHVLAAAPSQVSWFDLDAIARRDPARAAARWEEVKQAARGEIATGQRAARALEGYDSHCWSRARFLAVRSELSAAWRPRNAAEQHLIDQMAQWQTLIWLWQENVTAYIEIVFNARRRPPKRDESGELPRLRDADALERAVQMAERFHRLYLASLRALRELRRRPQVVVRAAGQVNIGGQQVNLSGAFGR